MSAHFNNKRGLGGAGFAKGGAGECRGRGAALCAIRDAKDGPETLRWPSEAAQPVQRYSYSSPPGSTSNSFSRTLCARRHFGQ